MNVSGLKTLADDELPAAIRAIPATTNNFSRLLKTMFTIPILNYDLPPQGIFLNFLLIQEVKLRHA